MILLGLFLLEYQYLIKIVASLENLQCTPFREELTYYMEEQVVLHCSFNNVKNYIVYPHWYFISHKIDLRGRIGSEGSEGNTGQTGHQGPIGDRGRKGENGDMGLVGEVGQQGPQGGLGEPGSKGDKGPQGLQGPPGIQGLDGSQGSEGLQGDQGPPGKKGKKGPQGSPGKDIEIRKPSIEALNQTKTVDFISSDNQGVSQRQDLYGETISLSALSVFEMRKEKNYAAYLLKESEKLKMWLSTTRKDNSTFEFNYTIQFNATHNRRGYYVFVLQVEKENSRVKLERIWRLKIRDQRLPVNQKFTNWHFMITVTVASTSLMAVMFFFVRLMKPEKHTLLSY